MLLTLDLLGIAVFAISGGLLAVRNQLDIVGLLTLATVTGLGGGVIRDLIIGSVPPPAVVDWRYLLAPVIGGLITFFWHPAVGRFERLVNVFDAFGLGLFAVAGAIKAEEYGMGPVPSALLGLITGVGGGVIRDLLVGRVPVILRHGELYAIPALAGAAVAATGVELGVPPLVIAWPALTVTVAWRLLALSRGWSAPVARLAPPAD